MFDRDPRITAMVEALYAVTAALNPGDILTHEMIRPVLQCEPHEDHWQHCVDKVRARLEKERTIATWPERTVGYRLLTPEEQITFLVRKRLKKAYRQQRRAQRSVAVLPGKNLSLHQRRVQAFTLDMLKRSQSAIRRELKDHATAIRPTVALPRREPIVRPNREARVMEAARP